METHQEEADIIIVQQVLLCVGEARQIAVASDDTDVGFFAAATVNQQILAAITFDISQKKMIWRLLNLASPHGPSMQCMIDVYVGGDKY